MAGPSRTPRGPTTEPGLLYELIGALPQTLIDVAGSRSAASSSPASSCPELPPPFCPELPPPLPPLFDVASTAWLNRSTFDAAAPAAAPAAV